MARTLAAASTLGDRQAASSLRPRLLACCCVALLLLHGAGHRAAADAALFVPLPKVLSPPFAINSTYTSPRCAAKYSCSLASYDAEECSCHAHCYAHDSCCADTVPVGDAAVAAAARLRVDPSLYTCASALLLTAGLSKTVDDLSNVYVVDRCPPGAFDGGAIAGYCGNPLNQIWNDTLSAPVTHTTTGVTYRNVYCALCHGVKLTDVAAWTYGYNCYGSFSQLPVETYYGVATSQGCLPGYQKPAGAPPAHDCRPNLVRSCAASSPLASQLGGACSSGPTQYAYDVGRKIVYRNHDCAGCALPPDADSLSCATWPVSYLLPMPPPLAGGAGNAVPTPLQSYACPAALSPTASADEIAAWLELCPNLKVAARRCAKPPQNRRK